MKQLLDNFKQRLHSLDKMIAGFKSNGSISDVRKDERLKTKASTYRTIIAEMERDIKNSEELKEREIVNSEELKEREIAMHKKHCSVNGCKYQDPNCLVASGEIKKDGIPEFKYDTPQERIWTVPVCRTGYGHRSIQVIAVTEKEAIEKALDEAGNESFSENDADYTAPDGAF